MTDIFTIDAEKEDLGTHVDLCAQRYSLLEKRLTILEVKVDKINDDILNGQRSLKTVIITSAAGIVTSLLAVVLAIIMKF